MAQVSALSEPRFSATNLIHTLDLHSDTILCLAYAASKRAVSRLGFLFSGSQDNTIRVWDLFTFRCVKTLRSHKRSVMSMCVWPRSSDDDSETLRPFLVSSSRDNTIIVWSCDTLQPVFILSDFNSCVFKLDVSREYLYGGCLDSTIVRIHMGTVLKKISERSDETKPVVETMEQASSYSCVVTGHIGCVYSVTWVSSGFLCSGSADMSVKVWSNNGNDETMQCVQTLSGHTDAITAVCSSKSIVFSGSKDRTVKVWNIETGSFHLVRTLTGHTAAICAVEVAEMNDVFLLSASTSGEVRIWNTKSYRCIRMIDFHNGSQVMSFTSSPRYIFSGGVDTNVHIWGQLFRDDSSREARGVGRAQASYFPRLPRCADLDAALKHFGLFQYRVRFHEEKVDLESLYLLTDDDLEKLNVPVGPRRKLLSFNKRWALAADQREIYADAVLLDSVSDELEDMIASLAEFVAIKTISVSEAYREDCWTGATYLQAFLRDIGAECLLVQGRPHKNPVVIAKFSPTHPDPDADPDVKLPRVAIYGHYDVQNVVDNKWKSPPFRLTGRNGYLYGRGATDDKGPIIAMAFAMKELLHDYNESFPIEVVMIIEGEEESNSSSGGLKECVVQNREWIGPADVIVGANTYWLDDTNPCLIYGLRGVIHLQILVDGPTRDLHSGVHGGTFNEPMTDLLYVLSKIVDKDGKVLLPGFYDGVLPMTDAEEKLYKEIDFDIDRYKEHLGVSRLKADETTALLKRRWREPSFSVHSINATTASPGIVPKAVLSKVSFRTVPNQSMQKIVESFHMFVKEKFEELRSGNAMHVTEMSRGDYWLGNPHDQYFTAAGDAIKKHWGKAPMFIREGGTMPATRCLEQIMDAPAVHIPFGQSTDQAHLENERIRLENLVKGKDVMKTFLLNLCPKPPSSDDSEDSNDDEEPNDGEEPNDDEEPIVNENNEEPSAE